MFERIKQVVIKEFIQTFRDKRMRFFLIIPPIIQLMMFGYVVTLDVDHIPTAVYDLDQSADSRELVRRLAASGYFIMEEHPRSSKEIMDLLDRGKILCAIQINQDFQEKVRKGIPTAVQVLVDGTDSNTALIAMGYVERIIAGFSSERDRTAAKIRAAGIDLRTRAWYNPDLKSRNYNVPGVIASILMLICLMLTAMAIVREREVGTMEQLMVTPISAFELMLGKTIPFALIGFLDMALITVVGITWFGVPIRGSFLLLFFSTGVYILSAIGIGLFISTVSRTQQQALMATMLFYMPAILLSGFAFPVENMPLFFQYVTWLNPLRYYLVIIRGIFLKGIGISILWPYIAALFVLGISVIALAAVRLRKRDI
jgi:ABC-2 type transport system permease protein